MHQVLATTVVMGAVLAVFIALRLFAVPGDKEVRSVATPPNEAAQGKR